MKLEKAMKLVVSGEQISQELLDAIDILDGAVAAAKKRVDKQLKDTIDTGGSLVIGKYEFTKKEVYRKTYDKVDKPDERFLKTEEKLNTKVIDEYVKEHGELPDRVFEVKSYDRVYKKDLEKKKANEQKRREFLESQKPKIDNPLAGIKFKKKA